ncbi:Adenylate cyclase 2 [bacterium HR15]|nr:Adenylate cyclase 2 [bacterium HR15]
MGMSIRLFGGRVYGAWRALGCCWQALTLMAFLSSLLVLAMGGLRAAGWTLFGFWVAANALTGLRVLLWGLWRPRLWGAITTSAFGWSFVGAFLAAILVPVWSAASASATGEVTFGSAFLLLLAGIAFGFTLIIGFIVSVMGAGLGLMAGGERWEQAARWGLTACWSWQAMGLVGALLSLPTGLVLTIWLGVPLLTLGTVRLLIPGSRIDTWLLLIRPHLRRAFILRGQWGTRSWRLDMRGAAVGITVALFTGLVWQMGLLQPLQASSLAWLIQFRNEPWVLQRKGVSVDLWQSEATRRVVLLGYDQDGYAALGQDSECAVLARAIRQLHAWRVRVILAPLPLLEAEPGQSEPFQRLAQRNRRDLNLLRKAAHEAGNVVWIVPAASRLPKEAQQLLSAGRAVGAMARIRYFAPGLPAIERDKRTVAPALAAMHLLDIRDNAPSSERFLLTDFYGEQTGEAFVRAPISCILKGKPFYWTGARRVVRDEFLVEREQLAPQPILPRQLLADRIAILPALQPDLYLTPVGRMDGQELIAHQLASLLHGTIIRTPSPGWILLALLLMGLISGHLCLRRAPIEAWWTAIVIAIIIWLGSIGLFVGGHIWFDPFLPLLSVALTALMVSQLTFVSESAERARHRALLQRLVAPAVAEQLLEDFEARLRTGGMRSSIGVLFADIRNFTPFAEAHTPEQVVERLNRYLGILTETLHAHQGILDKYTGDGLMAIFASHLLPEPETEEQLICRAVRAAIAMQHALLQLNRSSDPPLGMGIGLHFGEAVLGLLGGATQFNYTAVGRTVVIAARLQALARAGEIVMSEVVYQVAHKAGILHELSPETVQLKGMTAPFIVYRLCLSQ